VAGRLKQKLMFDGRNLFEPEIMKAKGWTYHSIGRPPVGPV
jgi:UDPglucose 6-dehydrogenase